MGEPEITPIASSGLMEWVVNMERERIRRGPATRWEPPYFYFNERRCIFKLPASVRKQPDDDQVYRPYRVSLGPYFHGDEKCEAREKDKEECLLHFMSRSDIPLERYLAFIGAMVDDLIDAYEELDERWRQDREVFGRMMLLDGCFTLEVIRTIVDLDAFENDFLPETSMNPKVSTILYNPGEIECYLHDMLLLENQLPMKLLGMLWEIHEQHWEDFLRKVEVVFNLHRHTPISTSDDTLHLLEFYRTSRILHTPRKSKILIPREPLVPREFYNIRIPSATELHNVGIGFRSSNSGSLLDFWFRRNTLFLPKITADGSTKSVFLNMITLEKVQRKFYSKGVTQYMFIMGCLVQSANDANLLQSRGIIITPLPAPELLQLFNRITKDISIHTHFSREFHVMVTALTARYNKLSNEWRKDLFQTYLRSPWAVMSVIAGVLLFTLSIIQTVYTVLSYVRPK